MMVANTRLDKIFCTTGFSYSILYLSTLNRLGFSKSDVRPMEQTIQGNLGEELESMGKITLNVTAGERPRFRTFMVEFLFIYSIIRFSTEAGIGEVRGSQQIARDCEKAILEKARSKDPSINKVAVVM
ncbi:hypothetical protein M0R45_001264 [Rubus argutus]|uniref:Uncharacterized protein n=1 Tax=Rubus argutus TaxID=59490 RepID=A0AAW1VID1_RUBAR